MGLRVIDCL
jgi:CTP synthase